MDAKKISITEWAYYDVFMEGVVHFSEHNTKRSTHANRYGDMEGEV
jgi:hypothetical protein